MYKSIPFFLALWFFAFISNATTRTVLNFPSGLAQYNTLQAAVDASAHGDTIVVHGSPIVYAGCTIADKKIILIGPGFSPEKNNPQTAKVNTNININAFTNVVGNADGCAIHGMDFISNANIQINQASINGEVVKNITINKNSFANIGLTLGTLTNATYSGYIISNNYFRYSAIAGGTTTIVENMLIKNNVFYSATGGSRLFKGMNNTIGVFIDHNLFYQATSSNSLLFAAFNSGEKCSNLILSNNIFCGMKNVDQCLNSTFINNVFYDCVSNTPWTANGNIDGGGNLSSVNPMLVDQNAVDGGTNNPLLNFKPTSSSPCLNAGNDGKDIGLLYEENTSYDYTQARNSILPYIVLMYLNKGVITKGETIQLNLNARKSK
ncbi:MAG: hypothetical protein R2831_02580 [Chitinophagaceae bacterium]